MRIGMGCGLVLVALTGCEEVIDLDPIDVRAPIEARVRPMPISGGTLTVTRDGVAVAADPDRDRVHLVDIASRRSLHTVVLEAGDEPGRVVEGKLGQAHVVLRGGGGFATLDLRRGTVLARHALCSEPRGIAFDDEDSTLFLACADGTLFHLDAASGDEIDRVVLEPDLRDVVLADGMAHVSLFRAAALVGEDGSRIDLPQFGSFVPHVAWRTWSDDSGRIFMLHQLADTNPVPLEPEPSDFEPGGELPYGGSSGFCSLGIAGAAFTTIDHGEISMVPVPNARLAVDASRSPSGWMALAMPGVKDGESSVALIHEAEGGCSRGGDAGREIPGQVTSVAFHGRSTLVMQSREPARLLIQAELPSGTIEIVELEGEPRYDSGHEIFHRATESGLSCATCHPEGTDDGHVWTFEGLGRRRTQPLDVGLAGTAPFHWDGDMGSLDVLMEEVLAHRMGGMRQSTARGESFASWVFAQQRPAAATGRDEPGLVGEGEALFAALDCGSCHTGDKLGGVTTEPIRGIELQVPSLRRVSLRPPFMHDGRSHTLDEAVRDMIESTTPAELSDHDVEALSAYLRTL